MPERAGRHGEKITTTIARTVLWAVYLHRNSRVAVLLEGRRSRTGSGTETPYYFLTHYSHNTWTEFGGRSEVLVSTELDESQLEIVYVTFESVWNLAESIYQVSNLPEKP